MLGRRALAMIPLIILTACGQSAATSTSGPSTGAAPSPVGQDRTVIMAVRYEPPSLVPKAGTGLTAGAVRPFNAALFLVDGDGNTKPYLAASLPQLNTDTWRVSPDGHMEVTYQLKPGLTWHDGEPITADDFAFAYRVYASPVSGMFAPTPQNYMDSVDVQDPLTFVISWNRPYPDAANIAFGDFEPLPRHILEGPFQTAVDDPNEGEAFRTNTFFSGAYVGAGPYRLERWDPGTELDGVAFDGHALGRPKINKFIVRIMPDENAVLSNLLAGSITVGGDFTLRYEQGKALKQDWDTSKRGVVQNETSSLHHILIQFRPDYLKVPALSDVRVRRALAYSIDRDSLNEGIFDGNPFATDTGITHDARYYPELDKEMTHYPYDPRKTEQLMTEAGFTKDAQGKFASASGDRFSPEFIVEQGTAFERTLALMTETWSRSGIEVQPGVLPTTAMRNNEIRATFSAMYAPSTSPGEKSLQIHSSTQIGSPANGWIGGNRGGWSNPEYDRLFDLYSTTLERSERDKLVIEMVKLESDQLPAFYTYFNIGVLAYLADLQGPATGNVDRLHYWNIHEWEFK